MEQEQGNFESFLKWAAKLGISDSPHSESTDLCLGHSLTVSHFPYAGGRGLGAARDLREGELILRVQKSALMTKESLLKDHKLSLAIDRHPSLFSTQILAVCLLNEMGKGKLSPWHPYLMHLPHSYNILATFGEFEKQALQVEDAIWTTEKAVLKAESEWKEASELMKELKLKPRLLTFKAWLWASATLHKTISTSKWVDEILEISSRTLHIPWDEAGCLCPVGDLFNYAAPGGEPNDFASVESWTHACSLEVSPLLNKEALDNTNADQFEAHLLRLTDGGFEEDLASYCFYARRNYKKGEQVLLSYGTYTNLELLEHYGFLLNENPNDKAFIPLVPDMYSSISWPKESMYIRQNGKPSFALLSALRLWATPAKQRKSVGHLVYSGSKISVANEICVMEWISKNCKVILKNLPTSIEEDSLLLSAIDKIQDSDNHVEQGKLLHALEGELHAFLEANNLQNEENNAQLLLSRKFKVLVDKWKLAVQWRLRYKKILADCISYCSGIINSLSCPTVSNIRTI